MDVYCPVCAEPADVTYFHDVAAELRSTFDQVRVEFFTKGCGVAFKHKHCRQATGANAVRADYSRMLYEVLDDDIDAIACEIEDAEYMGAFGSE